MRDGRKQYPLIYASRASMICHWVMSRLARSGRLPVSDANRLLVKVCNRYSKAPKRTYEANEVSGYGYLVIGDNGNPSASAPCWVARVAAEEATDEAQAFDIPHCDLKTRMVWLEGRYEQQKECRWCGEPTLFRESWISKADGSIRCNRRDCRRLDYLQHTPQSRGGIDLTPNQRKALSREAWNTQKTINYLALVAKEAKRGRKSNHDVR